LNELLIALDGLNLPILWGADNEHFDYLKKQFPKLRIVARGSEMKVLGDAKELDLFEQSFKEVMAHLEKFNNITLLDFEISLEQVQVLAVQQEKELAAKHAAFGSEPIVYGPNGLIVRARTANQRKMVDKVFRKMTSYLLSDRRVQERPIRRLH
jgi:phosphate starvation-inducible PhoH-like protein